jgi:hypothetical protein
MFRGAGYRKGCDLASVNKVILVGNIGRDPEIRYLPSGTPLRSGRLNASDLSATEPLGNHYEDFLASLYLPVGQVPSEKVRSSTPTVLNKSDCGQNKSRRRVPIAHSGSIRSTSFFGSNKANKRNAP